MTLYDLVLNEASISPSSRRKASALGFIASHAAPSSVAISIRIPPFWSFNTDLTLCYEAVALPMASENLPTRTKLAQSRSRDSLGLASKGAPEVALISASLTSVFFSNSSMTFTLSPSVNSLKSLSVVCTSRDEEQFFFEARNLVAISASRTQNVNMSNSDFINLGTIKISYSKFKVAEYSVAAAPARRQLKSGAEPSLAEAQPEPPSDGSHSSASSSSG
ncbi:uncharacterized protein LACBIDRAFT_333270 [Laccaria bicolor S238N-H82]|uniref:Predicted protein n=1 Tax=Laccaria bicolor (strain S238N-H82 / ATCC MYA-4686) TaxID=486041 RepID=B0DVF5_LACBS|nr:uncharacterized protein LACBIDRAFT_333270 [Laccaria bicolor S238N-H82]EDR01374.1 predicted protein [Laccaria bicolor S238N-H82]|eukprot:XP_001887919.1 predicted protein [Laccaria bicolor S238N-H82]